MNRSGPVSRENRRPLVDVAEHSARTCLLCLPLTMPPGKTQDFHSVPVNMSDTYLRLSLVSRLTRRSMPFDLQSGIARCCNVQRAALGACASPSSSCSSLENRNKFASPVSMEKASGWTPAHPCPVWNKPGFSNTSTCDRVKRRLFTSTYFPQTLFAPLRYVN